MPPRPVKKRGKSKKGRAREANPVVFRLSGLATRSPVSASPPSTLESRDDRGHPMAVLLAGVSPLDGVERVARPAKRSSSAHGVLAPKEAIGVQFVLRRDAGGVHAYRADLPSRTVVPGRAAGWSPEVELDLHGLRARQVDARIMLTISECKRRRRTRVLVIHGKGLHSVRGESVLAEAAIESLTNGRYARYVLAFSTAPDRLGGAGALAVDLESFRS